MPFLHPLIFWMGLGAVSIPIIIYILNRRRFKMIDWAAMRFLLDALRKNRRRLRLEELILLLIRCLIVMLLGLGLSRFIGCGDDDSLGNGNGGRSVVFVLDDSISMGQKRGGSATAFTLARKDLADRIAKLSSKDHAAIILTSRPSAGDAFLRMGPVGDPQGLASRIKTLEPRDTRTHLAEAMAAANELLRDTDGKKHLYILSDFRKIDITGAAATGPLQKAFANLGNSSVKTLVMNFGLDSKRNLTVESLELNGKFATARGESRITVSVRNNGSMRVENVPVSIWVSLPNGEKLRNVKLPEMTIKSLDPEKIWKKDIFFTPEKPGFAVINATLPADDLPGDNSGWLSLDVQKATKVLLVDGHPNMEIPEESESYFLRLALDPTGRADHGYDVEVIKRNDLPATRFENYDAVFLLNVSGFPLDPQPVITPDKKETIENYPSLLGLEQYVSAGGGLVIFTGDRIDTNFYNGRLFKKGRGLNPLPLRAKVGDPENRDVYFEFAPGSIRPDGVMQFFSGEASVLVKLIRFFAFNPADVSGKVLSGSGDEIASPIIEATYNDPNSSPAVISRRFGKGRVVMFTTTSSLDWNDWAMDSVDQVRGLYVLYMAELVDRVARKKANAFTADVEQSITYPISDDLRDTKVTIRNTETGSDITTLVPQAGPAGQQVTHNKILDAGIYRLIFRSPDSSTSEKLFARNPDGLEGLLDVGDKKNISAALGSSDYSYIDRSKIQAGSKRDRLGDKQYWVWIIIGLCVLLGVETFLAQRFGHWK
ncbi:MAG: BatA and WFA domain-containing protein [Phycisphaerae bacterium]|nr:BatA and WFA domain-containing protein [Phycisphaerae bacterium]